jgi:uncharacterized protein
MTSTDTIALPVTTPGTSRSLKVRRYGRPGARPKTYVQAGIHADELPANLVAHHLAGLLGEADRAGAVLGEIVLVPLANPIGLSNILFNDHLGRHHAPSGQNFNRGWPNVAEAVAEAVRGRLGDDGEANAALVRRAIAEELDNVATGNEAETLRLGLMKLAADADVVLDLHTDSEAELHLYVDPAHWPGAADLAGLLGASVVMTCRGSGNDPFEETVSRPWWLAGEGAPEAPLELPLAAVVELRGEGDVSDELAGRDADALLRFLVQRGVVAGKKERRRNSPGLPRRWRRPRSSRRRWAGSWSTRRSLATGYAPARWSPRSSIRWGRGRERACRWWPPPTGACSPAPATGWPGPACRSPRCRAARRCPAGCLGS